MCAALCVICFVVILSDYVVTKNARLNARRVVVASATFDRAGRLLVKPDGMLPTSVVETNVPLKVRFVLALAGSEAHRSLRTFWPSSTPGRRPFNGSMLFHGTGPSSSPSCLAS